MRLDFGRRCPKELDQEMQNFPPLFEQSDLERRSNEVLTDNCLLRREDFR